MLAEAARGRGFMRGRIFVVFVVIGLCSSAFSAELISSGAWDAGENWSEGVTPTSSDNATLGTVVNPALSATISATVSASIGGLSVGDSDSAQLGIVGGSLVNGRAFIGNRLSALGVVSVSAGGNWTSTDLLVGSAGQGRISLTGGWIGAVNSSIGTNAGSIGTVEVKNADSRFVVGSFLNVGNSGLGQLSILAGGTVETPGTATLGTNGAGNGTVLVSGAGSQWKTGSFLNVGYRGAGNLTISDGGSVIGNGTSSFGTLTSGSSGVVTVDGVGSRWVSPTINLGYAGSGQLIIRAGGTVEAATAFVIGRNATSSGSLTIESGGTLRTSTLNGGSGKAQVTLAGGTVQVIQSNLATSLNATLQAGTISTLDTNGLSATFSGVLSGGGSLIKDGEGTLVLAGVNSYAGGTIIRAGTLQTNSAQSLGVPGSDLTLFGGRLDLRGQSSVAGSLSGENGAVITNLAVNSVSTLTTNFSTNATFGGAIVDGPGGGKLAVVKLGAGELTLTGASAYAGTTTLGGGKLIVSGSGARVGNATSAGDWVIGAVTNDAGALSVVDGAGVVSGDLKLGKVSLSEGLVEVTGNGTSVRAATAEIGEGGSGRVIVSNGASLNTTSTSVIALKAGSSGSVTVTGTNATWTTSDYLDVGAAGNGTMSVLAGGRIVTPNTGTIASILGGAGSVNVSGEGSQWSANNINVGYLGKGDLSVASGGIVTISQALGIGVKAEGYGTLNLQSGGVLRVGSLFASQGNSQVNLLGGTLSVLGTNFNSSAAINLGDGVFSTVDTNGQNATLSGSLSGTGGLIKAGSGSLLIGGNNTFAGGVKIAAGTLKVASNNALGGAASTLEIGPTGKLDLNGQSVTIAGLTGGGTVTNEAVNTTAAVAVSVGGESATFAGTLQDGGTGRKLSLTKLGGGELVLSGTNPITGVTTVQAGRLSVSGPAASLGSVLAPGNVVVGSIASSPTELVVSAGGVVRAADLKLGKAALSSGNTTVNGAGSSVQLATLEVGEAGNGQLTISAGGQVTSTGAATLGVVAGAVGRVMITDSGSLWSGADYLNIGGAGNGTLEVVAGARVDTTTSGTIGANSGGVGFVSVSGNGSQWTAPTLNLGYQGSGRLDIADGGVVTANQTIGLGVKAGGVGTLNLLAGGMLRTGNLYGTPGSSQLNLGGGTLQILGGSFSSSVNASLAAGTRSTVDTNGQNATMSGVLSGSGGLVKTGAGILTIGGNNTFTGDTILAGGTIKLNSATALGSGGGGLQIDTGTLDLNGQSLVTGNLSGLGGTITNLASTTTASMKVNAAGNATYGGSVTDGGTGRTVALVKAGSGELILTGASSHTGGTVVQAGNLTVSGDGGVIGALTTIGNFVVGLVSGDAGILNVRDGAKIVAADVKIGKVALSGGSLRVYGSGSSVQTATLEVGEGGSGDAQVSNGAILSATNSSSMAVGAGSAAVASVNGTGSQWNSGDYLTVGLSGNATLTVADGGTLRTTKSSTIGSSASGRGSVMVSGNGASWTAGDYLNVGFQGVGGLVVGSGGSVSSKLAGTVATNAGSSGQVSVSGSDARWSAPNINVGYAGAGSVDVSGGGTISAPQGILVGALAGSSGTLTVGAGGVVETAGIYGGAGANQVKLSGGTLRALGGDFSTSLNVSLAAGTQSIIDSNGLKVNMAGVLSGAGGIIKNGNGSLTLSGNNTYSGPTVVNGGLLMVHGNQSAAKGEMVVAEGATLGGVGTLGGAVKVNGVLSPGITVGSLTMAGLTLGATAVSQFEINSATAGSFDQINLLGPTATLDGVLKLIFGGILTRNQSIDLFLGPAILSGDFDAITVSGGGYVAGSFFKSGKYWINQQGATALQFDPATGILSVVPEPGTLGLVLIAGVVFLRLARNRQRKVSREFNHVGPPKLF